MTLPSCWLPDRVAATWLATALLVAALATVAGCAEDKGMVAEAAWSRPAAAGGSGAVYLSVHNATGVADRIAGGSSEVCDTVELHRTEVVDDRMTMRHLADGVPLGAGERFEFVPGDYHVMLLGLRQPLELGSRFTLSLEFEQAGVVPVEVEVRR